MEQNDFNDLADAVDAELASAGIPQDARFFITNPIREGNDERLDEVFVTTTFAQLPGTAGIANQRPVRRVGAFPEQPQLTGPGARMVTAREIRTRVAERRALLARYGETAYEAAPGIKEPVV